MGELNAVQPLNVVQKIYSEQDRFEIIPGPVGDRVELSVGESENPAVRSSADRVEIIRAWSGRSSDELSGG